MTKGLAAYLVPARSSRRVLRLCEGGSGSAKDIARQIKMSRSATERALHLLYRLGVADRRRISGYTGVENHLSSVLAQIVVA